MKIAEAAVSAALIAEVHRSSCQDRHLGFGVELNAGATEESMTVLILLSRRRILRNCAC